MPSNEQIHKEEHPLAGKVILIADGTFAGQHYRLEDWWDRLGQGSWKWAQYNPACLEFAMRMGMQEGKCVDDDEVVYGKIDGMGKLIHISQLGEPIHAE